MFQIKDFASIAASMINYAKASQDKLTDFTIGSVARTLLEAPAVEMEELYQQMWLGLKEGIPVALYQAFNFNRLPAAAAQGLITVTISPGAELAIPAGTRFISSETTGSYVSVADVVIAAAGTTATLLVAAESSGVILPIFQNGEFKANIDRLESAVAAYNFTNGIGEETDAARKQRFINYIQNIARSPNDAIHYALTTVSLRDANNIITESVQQALVIEKFMTDPPSGPVGTLNCYIHNGVSGASTELIAEALKIVSGYTDNGVKVVGWKAAGIKVIIEAVENIAVDITANLTISDGYAAFAIKRAVGQAISNYINNNAIGAPVIRAEIITAAMEVEGVTNIALSGFTTDMPISPYQKAMPGTYVFS